MSRYFRQTDRVFSNPGDRLKVEYSAKFDEFGNLVLEECGVRDVYLDIQQYTEQCKISNIINRYIHGETDVLQRIRGFYGDVSAMPTSYQEVLNRIEDGKRMFASMPADVRSEFNNSFEQFIVATEKPNFMQRLKGRLIHEQKHNGQIQRNAFGESTAQQVQSGPQPEN